MKKFLLNLIFLAVVTPLAAQTLILPGDYADPIILKDGDLGRGLIVASVHGNGNPCTDASRRLHCQTAPDLCLRKMILSVKQISYLLFF